MDLDTLGFDTISLATLDEIDVDDLPFGVVGLALDGVVTRYNLCESQISGLSAERVVGRRFFADVAPCMDNALVGRRLETADEIDETLEYMLSLRMKPTNVRLRLLRSPAADTMYLLVDRT